MNPPPGILHLKLVVTCFYLWVDFIVMAVYPLPLLLTGRCLWFLSNLKLWFGKVTKQISSKTDKNHLNFNDDFSIEFGHWQIQIENHYKIIHFFGKTYWIYLKKIYFEKYNIVYAASISPSIPFSSLLRCWQEPSFDKYIPKTNGWIRFPGTYRWHVQTYEGKLH